MKNKTIKLFDEEIELIHEFVNHKNNHLEENEPKWKVPDVIECAFQIGFQQMLKENEIEDNGFYKKL